ncbi:MAG TPA: prephenate dehydrogenase [Planctomycetaceae bacterium]|nr:prephenate dehydrogenase [Planctomycetaceae bacterium]
MGSTSRDFGTIAIVGVGLIGGSIALAAKLRGLASAVLGVGRDAKRLEEARRRGVVDEGLDLAAAARGADLLIFCTPVDRIVVGAREAAAACRPGALITDAGSIKAGICRDLERNLPRGVDFVGSHPLAGSERQGFENADARLFENRVCVVTPVENCSRAAIERIGAFWTSLGAKVVEMSPEAHDHALAETSHLPHMIAAALAGTLSPGNRNLAASGFRDTTRIASGDPGLWAAILFGNRQQVLDSLSRYDRSLSGFRRALEDGDLVALKQLLQAAKTNREQIDALGN